MIPSSYAARGTMDPHSREDHLDRASSNEEI